MVGKVVAHEIVGAKFIIWIKPHIFLLACTVLLNLTSNFIAPLGTHCELWSELSVNHWTDFWTVALLIYGKVFVQNSTRMIVGYVIQGRLDIVLWSLPFLGVCYKLWPSLTPMVSLKKNYLRYLHPVRANVFSLAATVKNVNNIFFESVWHLWASRVLDYTRQAVQSHFGSFIINF